MKTQFITLAIILLFSIHLSAKENTSVNTDEVRLSEISKSVYEAESGLAIESWMTNDDQWKLVSTNEHENVTSVEESLQLEEWMTDAALWNQNATQFSFENENEEPLTIESWMTNDARWMM